MLDLACDLAHGDTRRVGEQALFQVEIVGHLFGTLFRNTQDPCSHLLASVFIADSEKAARGKMRPIFSHPSIFIDEEEPTQIKRAKPQSRFAQFTSTPATTPTTRPHATTRPPPTPPKFAIAHPCLGPVWTTRGRPMTAFMANHTEHSTYQARTTPRRHPAQPVTMRAKSGGSTPTRSSDLAYGAPR